MKALLTIATAKDVQAGTETYADHLHAAFPDLRIVDAHSRFAGIPLVREPMRAAQLTRAFSREQTPEILFTNGMFGWTLPRVSYPVINIQHGTYAGFAEAALKKSSVDYWRIRYLYAACEKRSAQKSTCVVANSGFTRSMLQQHYGVESTVIHNAIDTDTFRPYSQSSARKKLGLPEQKICLFVGRPDKTKGFDVVLRLAKKHPNILFVCVLFPGYANPLPNMRIVPRVSHSTLPLYYAAADLLLNPSLFEGFGYVSLEALSCNLPVATTKVGVFHDMQIPGAHIVESDDDFSTFIASIPSKKNTHTFIEKMFSLPRFIREYRRLAAELGKRL